MIKKMIILAILAISSTAFCADNNKKASSPKSYNDVVLKSLNTPEKWAKKGLQLLIQKEAQKLANRHDDSLEIIIEAVMLEKERRNKNNKPEDTDTLLDLSDSFESTGFWEGDTCQMDQSSNNNQQNNDTNNLTKFDFSKRFTISKIDQPKLTKEEKQNLEKLADLYLNNIGYYAEKNTTRISSI